MVERTLMGPGGSTEAKQDQILAEIASGLNVRQLSLLLDSVRQTLRISTPLSQSVSGVVTDQVLISVPTGSRLRLLRNAGHTDPQLNSLVFPVVTLKIGSTVIYQDKLEAGLPWSETVCFEGADGEDLTISVNDTATIYLNLRYELF